MGELAPVSCRLLAVRVRGTERVPAAPNSHFSPALVALLAPSSTLLAPCTQLQVHLSQQTLATKHNVIVAKLGEASARQSTSCCKQQPLRKNFTCHACAPQKHHVVRLKEQTRASISQMIKRVFAAHTVSRGKGETRGSGNAAHSIRLWKKRYGDAKAATTSL